MTKTAVLMCGRCGAPCQHSFVRRHPITDSKGFHLQDNLIFACPAGHERVWGNEGGGRSTAVRS